MSQADGETDVGTADPDIYFSFAQQFTNDILLRKPKGGRLITSAEEKWIHEQATAAVKRHQRQTGMRRSGSGTDDSDDDETGMVLMTGPPKSKRKAEEETGVGKETPSTKVARLQRAIDELRNAMAKQQEASAAADVLIKQNPGSATTKENKKNEESGLKRNGTLMIRYRRDLEAAKKLLAEEKAAEAGAATPPPPSASASASTAPIAVSTTPPSQPPPSPSIYPNPIARLSAATTTSATATVSVPRPSASASASASPTASASASASATAAAAAVDDKTALEKCREELKIVNESVRRLTNQLATTVITAEEAGRNRLLEEQQKNAALLAVQELKTQINTLRSQLADAERERYEAQTQLRGLSERGQQFATEKTAEKSNFEKQIYRLTQELQTIRSGFEQELKRRTDTVQAQFIKREDELKASIRKFEEEKRAAESQRDAKASEIKNIEDGLLGDYTAYLQMINDHKSATPGDEKSPIHFPSESAEVETARRRRFAAVVNKVLDTKVGGIGDRKNDTLADAISRSDTSRAATARLTSRVMQMMLTEYVRIYADEKKQFDEEKKQTDITVTELKQTVADLKASAAALTESTEEQKRKEAKEGKEDKSADKILIERLRLQLDKAKTDKEDREKKLKECERRLKDNFSREVVKYINRNEGLHVFARQALRFAEQTARAYESVLAALTYRRGLIFQPWLDPNVVQSADWKRQTVPTRIPMPEYTQMIFTWLIPRLTTVMAASFSDAEKTELNQYYANLQRYTEVVSGTGELRVTDRPPNRPPGLVASASTSASSASSNGDVKYPNPAAASPMSTETETLVSSFREPSGALIPPRLSDALGRKLQNLRLQLNIPVDVTQLWRDIADDVRRNSEFTQTLRAAGMPDENTDAYRRAAYQFSRTTLETMQRDFRRFDNEDWYTDQKRQAMEVIAIGSSGSAEEEDLSVKTQEASLAAETKWAEIEARHRVIEVKATERQIEVDRKIDDCDRKLKECKDHLAKQIWLTEVTRVFGQHVAGLLSDTREALRKLRERYPNIRMDVQPGVGVSPASAPPRLAFSAVASSAASATGLASAAAAPLVLDISAMSPADLKTALTTVNTSVSDALSSIEGILGKVEAKQTETETKLSSLLTADLKDQELELMDSKQLIDRIRLENRIREQKLTASSSDCERELKSLQTRFKLLAQDVKDRTDHGNFLYAILNAVRPLVEQFAKLKIEGKLEDEGVDYLNFKLPGNRDSGPVPKAKWLENADFFLSYGDLMGVLEEADARAMEAVRSKYDRLRQKVETFQDQMRIELKSAKESKDAKKELDKAVIQLDTARALIDRLFLLHYGRRAFEDPKNNAAVDEKAAALRGIRVPYFRARLDFLYKDEQRVRAAVADASFKVASPPLDVPIGGGGADVKSDADRESKVALSSTPIPAASARPPNSSARTAAAESKYAPTAEQLRRTSDELKQQILKADWKDLAEIFEKVHVTILNERTKLDSGYLNVIESQFASITRLAEQADAKMDRITAEFDKRIQTGIGNLKTLTDAMQWRYAKQMLEVLSPEFWGALQSQLNKRLQASLPPPSSSATSSAIGVPSPAIPATAPTGIASPASREAVNSVLVAVEQSINELKDSDYIISNLSFHDLRDRLLMWAVLYGEVLFTETIRETEFNTLKDAVSDSKRARTDLKDTEAKLVTCTKNTEICRKIVLALQTGFEAARTEMARLRTPFLSSTSGKFDLTDAKQVEAVLKVLVDMATRARGVGAGRGGVASAAAANAEALEIAAQPGMVLYNGPNTPFEALWLFMQLVAGHCGTNPQFLLRPDVLTSDQTGEISAESKALVPASTASSSSSSSGDATSLLQSQLSGGPQVGPSLISPTVAVSTLESSSNIDTEIESRATRKARTRQRDLDESPARFEHNLVHFLTAFGLTAFKSALSYVRSFPHFRNAPALLLISSDIVSLNFSRVTASYYLSASMYRPSRTNVRPELLQTNNANMYQQAAGYLHNAVALRTAFPLSDKLTRDNWKREYWKVTPNFHPDLAIRAVPLTSPSLLAVLNLDE